MNQPAPTPSSVNGASPSTASPSTASPSTASPSTASPSTAKHSSARDAHLNQSSDGASASASSNASSSNDSASGFLSGLLGAPKETKSAKKGSVPSDPGEISPFLSAQRYVEDRVAAEARGKQQFMAISLLLAVALTIALAGLVYLSTTSRVQPFMIVYSSETGQLLYKGDVKPLDNVPDMVTRSHLRGVLEGLRTVYTDRRATSKDFQEAYAYVQKGSEADAFLRDFLSRTGENPVAQVGDIQRSIAEMEVSKIAGTRSWSLRWVEREAQASGRVTQTVWQGSFSVNRTPSAEREKLEQNPSSIYVDGASWQQVSSKVLSQTDAPSETPTPPN